MGHVFGMESSLRHIETETMVARDVRHRRWAKIVREWGAQQGLQYVATDVAFAASTLTAFYYPEGRDDVWLRRVRDERGLELAPSNDPRLAGRYFRIGHLGDVPEEQLVKGLAILECALKENVGC